MTEDRSKLLDFLLRVFQITAKYEAHDELWWRTDGEYAPVTIWVNCNDVFWWGCADCEEVTPENLDILEKSFEDCEKAAPDDCCATLSATKLFCSRVRKLRPQGCCYPSNRALWPLFDECGPEREPGLGNPYRPGEREEKLAAKKALEEQGA